MKRRKRHNHRELPREEKVKDTLTKALEIPGGIISNTAQIELYGNTEMIVEGCRSIVEYDDSVIRLDLGKLIMRIVGHDLQIKNMTITKMVVVGQIVSIDFAN